MTRHPDMLPTKDRIESLDVLRGFALLGILLMNIQSFSMIEAAYFDPSLHMDLNGINWWVWSLSHALADSKFMAIFSILFGAGIVVLTQSREAAGLPVRGLHFRRTFWLFLFGMIHAYLIWYGDILVSYALGAVFVYWFRNLRPTSLFILGGCVMGLAPAVTILAGYGLHLAPQDVQNAVRGDFTPNDAAIAAEISAYRGTWTQALGARVQSALGMHTEGIPFYLFWRASGLMLIGMALFKTGVLSAQRSAAFYTWMMMVGIVLGGPLVFLSVQNLQSHAWDPLYVLLGPGMLYNYVGSLGIAAAYIALVMRLVQTNVFSSFQKRLAAVGRTAFTNYIMQSLLCTYVFYGFGLGAFGTVERIGQIGIVIALWLLQLTLAPLWLHVFRFGPLEWLWRSLTYWRLQPMRR